MPDEILDVVNDDDIVTGKELRSIVHRNGLQHRGVHVFLVTPDSHLLVQRRSKHKEVYSLALDCSVSEHVKAGEDYQLAAARGLKEELGISQIQLQKLVKFKMEYGENDFEICILYEGRVGPEQIYIDSQEVDSIYSYQLDELIEIIKIGEVAISKWFAEIIKWYVGMPSELNIMETYKKEKSLLTL